MGKEGVVIGYHAVEDLLKSGVTIGKVYVNSKADILKGYGGAEY
jgi:tRNA G18 (ribose-2'-O)-methylase SpoU